MKWSTESQLIGLEIKVVFVSGILKMDRMPALPAQFVIALDVAE